MRALALAILVAASSALAAAPSPEASTRKGQGDARRDAGDGTGALAAYREALQLSPDYVEAWEEIGKLYFGAKNFREAAEAFQRAVEIDGSYANNWFNLALAARRAGDMGRARDAYRTYLLIKPDDADARFRLAEVLRALNEREPALREYQLVADAADAHKVEPALGEKARGAIAQLQAEAQAPATSPAAAPPPSIPLPSPEPTPPVASPAALPASPPRVVIQPVAPPAPPPRPVAEPAAPPSPALLDKLALGDRLQASGDYRGALFAYQDAVYLDPRHAVARVKLGRAYWILRYVGQADEQWLQAGQLAPNDPSIAHMIEEARKAQRPAVPGTPDATAGGAPSDGGAGQGNSTGPSPSGSPAGNGPRIYKLAPEPEPSPLPQRAQSGGTTPGYAMPAPAQPSPPPYVPETGAGPLEYPVQQQPQPPPQYAPPQYPQQYGQQPQYGQPGQGQAPGGQPQYPQPGYAPPQGGPAQPGYGQPAQVPASINAAAQRYRAALSLYIQRDYLGAIAELDAAVTLDPNLAVAYTARGSAKFGLRKFREAAADYKAALDLDPARAEPIWGLAECQRMLRDPAAPDTYRRYAASLAGDVNEERRSRARRWATELAPSTR